MNGYCDPETGICTPSTLLELSSIGNDPEGDKQEIIYVGDPMCSWCWGISPDLIKLRDHYRESQVAFRIVLGGLRPGGGDPWDDQMKEVANLSVMTYLISKCSITIPNLLAVQWWLQGPSSRKKRWSFLKRYNVSFM